MATRLSSSLQSRLSGLRSRRARWVVPAAAVAAVIGVGPVVHAVSADARGTLPPRTAAQLLADVQQAKVKALSGTVVETTDLGLPALPSLGGRGGDAASFSSLISGSHTMRVWYDGPSHVRLALLGQLGESDLVRNGTDVWLWSSHDNTATHWTVPVDGQDSPGETEQPASGAMTPQSAAEAALKAIDPSTRVSTDPTATVAGRPAYVLSLVPRDERSLVGSVRIAIDGKAHIPTRVQIFARGASKPAFQVGFTSLTTATPASSVFGFRPPPGATVKQGTRPGLGTMSHRMPSGGHLADAVPRIVGKGWTTVVVGHLGSRAGDGSTALAGIIDRLPAVSGPWGSGHLLSSALFSAVLTSDGRFAVGAVPPHLLYDALARR